MRYERAMSLPPLVNETWYALRLGSPADAALAVIVDLSRGVVLAVGQAGVKSALRGACNKPLVGKSRRPKVVQVASEDALAELRGAMPGVVVEVAPAPDGVEQRARAHLQHQSLDVGSATWGYTREVFDGVLALGSDLLSVQPWQHLSDLDQLTIRAPDYGIDEGAMLVLGNAGRQLGFLLFPTVALAEEFGRLSRGPTETFLAATLSGRHLAFALEDETVVPLAMRQAAHRAGYASYASYASYEGSPYPFPLCVTTDLRMRPAGEAETQMLLAAGRALTVMAMQEEEKLARSQPALVEHEGVILLYHGHERAPADVVPIHGGPVAQPPDDASSRWRLDDFALLHRLVALADETFGPEWRAAAGSVGDISAPANGLVLWPTLLAEPRGPATALTELRLRHPAAFDARTEAILAAEAVAWTGLWEALDVVPGQGFEARDLLTHEARFVSDVACSHSLRRGTVICARIPTIGEVSWVAAADEHGLSPYHADRVRVALAEQLRWPKTRAVPIGKVLAARGQREAARLWREVVDAAKSAPIPELKIKDGEVLQIVRDRYRVSRPDLTKVAGAERPSRSNAPWFVRTGDGPFGKSDVTVAGDELRVESLSVAQADRIRARLEAAFGDSLGPLERQVRELADELAERRGRGVDLQVVPSEAEQQALEAYKANHYATWPDVPLPALGGKTPRQAAAQKRSRAQLERLIDDMEHHEQMSAPGTRYDFDVLRRALGLTTS